MIFTILHIYIVLPAQAGVILSANSATIAPTGTPRASGGDPAIKSGITTGFKYSPRKRG